MCCIAEGCSDHAAAFASKPAPTGDLWLGGISVQPKNLWEWACSRKRRVRSKICTDTLPSRASPLPQEICGLAESGCSRKTCGSGLAHESGGSGQNLYLTHCLREQARSHRRFVGWRGSGCSRKTCGSGLAHESGGSGQKCVSDTLPSRASPLPQEICGLAGIRVQPKYLWEWACSRKRRVRSKICI